MTDAETIEAARKLFANDTPGDKLGRRLLAIAERDHTENQQLRDLLSPLRDAVLYARAQRRPLGIGQDSEIGAPTVTIGVCPRYGRSTDNPGFWLDADTLEPRDAAGPSATKRIALELLRLAYAIADKVRT